MDLKTGELPRVAALEPPWVTRLFAFQETACLTLVALLREGQVVRGSHEAGRLTGEGASPRFTESVIASLAGQAMKVFKMVAGTPGYKDVKHLLAWPVRGGFVFY